MGDIDWVRTISISVLGGLGVVFVPLLVQKVIDYAAKQIALEVGRVLIQLNMTPGSRRGD